METSRVSYKPHVRAALAKWSQILHSSRKSYYKAAQRYSRKNKWLVFFMILTSTISGVFSLGGISNETVKSVFLYLATAFTALNILLTSLQTKLQYDKLATKFNTQSNGYLNIALKIDRERVLQNIDSTVLVNDVFRIYQNLEQSGLDLILPDDIDKVNLTNEGVLFKEIETDIETGDTHSLDHPVQVTQ